MDDVDYVPPRYALATSLDDADEDARYTRFVCRFHTLGIADGDTTGIGSDNGGRTGLRRIILGETLSTYSYDPEYANYRKRDSRPMLSEGHDEQIWNSVYVARCPVPDVRDIVTADDDTTTMTLTDVVASGKSVHDGVPSIYVDLIPIRTPVRRGRGGYAIPGVSSGDVLDPVRTWGDAHVLPRIEASGRWVNITICRTPRAEEEAAAVMVVDPSEQHARMSSSRRSANNVDDDVVVTRNVTRHFLVACV